MKYNMRKIRHRPWFIDRPFRTDYLIFGRPEILEPEIGEVVATLRSGWIGTGPRVAEFEKLFRDYVDIPHTLAVHSCTAALHLSMVALGLDPGDEVVVPAMTFAATANAIIHAGCTPVQADVNRRTMCLEPEHLESCITPKTRAVIPVHFAGRSCDMDALLELAQQHDLHIIEDCAHGVETLYKGRHAGTMGHMGAFSFYVTKNVVTGEGGMITTADSDMAARIKVLALHGMSADAWMRFSDKGFKHYDVVEPGFKYNMMDIQAALGIHQLKRVEENLTRRQQIWAYYDEMFADLPVFLPAPEEKDTRHARHLYTLLLDIDRLKVGRDEVQSALHRQNIGTGIHYQALHLHRYYRQNFGYEPDEFPNSLWLSERTLSLPLSSGLTEEDVEDVVFSVRRTLEYFTR